MTSPVPTGRALSVLRALRVACVAWLLSLAVGACSDCGGHEGLEVTPVEMQTLHVLQGATEPVVEYRVTEGGRPVDPALLVAGEKPDYSVSVEPEEAATLSADSSGIIVFRPSGKFGGLVTVKVTAGGTTVQREVMILLSGTQNGPTPEQIARTPSQIAKDLAERTAGGGIGGVGGEGLGTALTDPAVLTALEGTPTAVGSAAELSFHYPYDGTVWPRGLLAPLLMWGGSKSDAQGIRLELATTSGSYRWSGTFGRPTILPAAEPFVRHPIPQDVWESATQSAGQLTASGVSEKLTVKLTVVSGGVAVGPVVQTWTVAPVRLAGTIYYNSYGTRYVTNFTGAKAGDGRFGGAVLSIRVGDTEPKVAAGTNVYDTGCRVCHSVSANGSRLVTSSKVGGHEEYSYALSPTGITETAMGAKQADFLAMYPDGSMALTQSGKLLQMPDGSEVQAQGLEGFVPKTPIFDPLGTLVAFNAGHGKQLVLMDFSKGTRTFSAPRNIVNNDQPRTGSEVCPVWPAFLPDSKSLVFQQYLGGSQEYPGSCTTYTRKGVRGQVHWTNTAGDQFNPLNALNGLDSQGNSYLYKLANSPGLSCAGLGTDFGNIDPTHENDTQYNYEPTVSPIAGGGYAWVVFASRRMYGSVATIPPFCSDPRDLDLSTNITTKKLWVAAVDLTGRPGVDPSHPAFYLPGQEMLAGNSRGFWVFDPCRSDGASCESGDQCCNGFCTPSASGELQCSSAPDPNAQCSNEGDRCEERDDCCNPKHFCIGTICSSTVPLH